MLEGDSLDLGAGMGSGVVPVEAEKAVALEAFQSGRRGACRQQNRPLMVALYQSQDSD